MHTNALNPNLFSARRKGLLFKKKQLRREIEAQWNSDIPHVAASPISWGVLSHMVSDLSNVLPERLVSALRWAINDRSLKSYIDIGAEWGSPSQYDSPGSYFAATSVLSLFKKLDVKAEGLDPRATAIERFHIAETRCRNANRRLLHYGKFDHSDSRPLSRGLDAHQVFHLARRKIQSWLGPVDLEEILSGVRHGPGGVVGLKRPYTTPYYKFGVGDYTVSTGAYWYGLRAIAGCDSWVRALAQSEQAGWDHSVSCIPFETKIRLADSRISIADYNEVTFVPKNAKTMRAIAIEPRINVALQLSVGRALKGRLRQAGCDLGDQSRNQELARVGSIQSEASDPVTLDMEMASDSLCIELVRLLLPSDWFELLDSLRSRFGELDGKTIEWAKFSSMGNGFTFELESLIFLALAQSVSDLSGTSEWFASTFGSAYRYAYVSVYGDDLIVPQQISTHLIGILRYVGFRINSEKSFTTGPFRESCGSDFYRGVNVRPFYFQRGLSQTRDLIHLHNGLVWLTKCTEEKLVLTGCLYFVRCLIPKVLTDHLLAVTPTQGDEYVWCEPDEAHRSHFVTWDSDHQSWVYPEVKVSLDVYRGALRWRYVQFLYAGTAMEISHQDDDPYRNPLGLHRSSGGSAGDVVRSGGGQGNLTLVS